MVGNIHFNLFCFPKSQQFNYFTSLTDIYKKCNQSHEARSAPVSNVKCGSNFGLELLGFSPTLSSWERTPMSISFVQKIPAASFYPRSSAWRQMQRWWEADVSTHHRWWCNTAQIKENDVFLTHHQSHTGTASLVVCTDDKWLTVMHSKHCLQFLQYE